MILLLNQKKLPVSEKANFF